VRERAVKIAVIPARGGSKRIPRKNVRAFAGKPMIVWSIDRARASGLFDRVIVSTDDAEIAEVARSHGAEIPFMRPANLSDDYVGTTDVVAHAIETLRAAGTEPSQVCCIYATAPFLETADLERAARLFDTGRWNYVFAVTHFGFPIFRSVRLDAAGGIEMFFPEHYAARSQDLPEALHDTGQFYFGKPEAWTRRCRVFDRDSTAVVIPRWRVQDIDTEEDWTRAELMSRHLLPGAEVPA
jgi:pseudaminic acid cytidylyltransferase